MKYTISIDQCKCIEWGLNLSEGALMGFFSQLSTWAEAVIIDGEVFYFASRNKIIEELPIITDKPDTVYRLIKSLSSKSLIIHRKFGRKDLVKLTAKGKKWNSEKNPTFQKLGKKSDLNTENFPKNTPENSEKNPTNNNTTLFDNSTIYNKETSFLKKKIGLKHFKILIEASGNGCNSDLEAMQSDGRIDVLFDWLEYKKGRRQNYKNYLSFKSLIETKFKGFSTKELKEAFNETSANNWSGIFPKKTKEKKQPTSKKVIDQSKYEKYE